MTTTVRDLAPVDDHVRELAALIERLETALRDRPVGLAAATRAAECLSGGLPTPDILSADDQLGDPSAYRQHVLFVNRSIPFSIVALVWRAGQQTAIHDHRCWGAVAVLQGAEHETLYSFASEVDGRLPQLTPGRRTTYPAGDLSRSPHRVTFIRSRIEGPAWRSRCTFTAPTSPGTGPASGGPTRRTLAA